MWTSAGSPRVGGLFEIMKKARNVYHYAVRKVKKEAELIRAKKLFEAAETGSVDLLLEMKKIRGSKKTKHDLPDDVDGVNGELNIVEKFCEVYEQLYNSSGSNEALEEMKAQIRDLIEENGTDQEVMKITGSKVKEAACRMKAGKGDVTEGYKSDAILNAPDILLISWLLFTGLFWSMALFH